MFSVIMSAVSVSGHQKKLMLAVKRLYDLQRAHNHTDRAGGGTLQRKPTAALELMTIEHTPTHTVHVHTRSDNPNDCCPSPRIPRALLSFQDSELSAELQNAMMGNVGGAVDESFSIRGSASAARSVSQESISMRSRGSGNSGSSNYGHSQHHQTALPSVRTSSRSEESVRTGAVKCEGSSLGDRSIQRSPEVWEQSAIPNKLPFSTLTPPLSPCKRPHFVYPAVPPKAKHIQSHNHLYQPQHHPPSTSSCPSPQTSPTQKACHYLHAQTACISRAPRVHSKALSGDVSPLEAQHGQSPGNDSRKGPHKKRTQSLTRFPLSNGKPDEDNDLTPPYTFSSSVVIPSYATLSRKPGRGRTNVTENHHHINRSHSFAVRSRRKGPPPPPPKRMSSASGSPAHPPGNEKVDAEVKGEVEALKIGSVRSIAARLEGNSRNSSPSRRIDIPPTEIPVSPVFSRLSSPVSHIVQQHPKPVPAVGLGALKKTGSERTKEEAVKQRVGGREGTITTQKNGRSKSTTASPNHSSADHLPFAEEGNLTIKQRPRTAAEVKTPLEGPALSPYSLVLPEFNLKESDTVKRRHKPKESSTPEEATAATGEENLSQPNHICVQNSVKTLSNNDNDSRPSANVFQRVGSTRKVLKPPVSSKPPISLQQPFNSKTATPQKTLCSMPASTQTAIPKLTNVQIHTVSQTPCGSIQTPFLKLVKPAQTVMSKQESPQKGAALRIPHPSVTSTTGDGVNMSVTELCFDQKYFRMELFAHR